jgi:signal peptidase I
MRSRDDGFSMYALLLFAAAIAALLAIQIALTHGTAKLLRLPTATWRRAAVVVVILLLLNIAVVSTEYFAAKAGWFRLEGAGWIIAGLLLLAAILAIYRRAYRATGRHLWAFLALQFVLVGVSYAFTLPFVAYAVEAFRTSANSMAPAIRGPRLEATCPRCGAPAVATLFDEPDLHDKRAPLSCVQCDYEGERATGVEKPSDRFAVEKFRKPQRWDVVAYVKPREIHDQEGPTNFVHRLVGLPGEEIVIRDGAIYANGTKLEIPAALGQLRYTAQPDGGGFRDPLEYEQYPLLGDPKKPVRLGDDEYFFLGDNTQRSNDGRFHGPVKREAIIGVVTLIYWPPERWKILK